MAKRERTDLGIDGTSIIGQTLQEDKRTKVLLGKLLGLSVIGNIIAAVGVVMLVASKEPPIVNNYAVDAQGRLTKLEPVNRPLGITAVADFTTRAIQKAFTMNYRNYKEAMSDVAPMFSSGAFTSYRKGMEDGDTSIVGTLTKQNLAVETLVTAKRLIQKTTVAGRAAWILEVDANRTFFSSGAQKTVPVTYRLTVVRENSLVTPDMLVIYALVERARPMAEVTQ